MARIETWSKLKFFKANSKIDRWGDASAISDNLLWRLDDFRKWLGVPIYVTSGVRDGLGNSYHNISRGACAVDIVVPDYMETPFDLVMDATRFGFNGIGYYPHWKWKGEIVGGLHLDTRPLKEENDDTLNYSQSRWMGILSPENKQIYIELSFKNMLDYAMSQSDVGGMH